MHAHGPFEVRLLPQPADPAIDGGLGRMALDKVFRKDTMLATQGAVKGSAGYVVMERVTGTLHGQRGSFVLQHSGTMNRGTPTLVIFVVPDSGTEELTGLSGTMTIIIADGRHSYDFHYDIATA